MSSNASAKRVNRARSGSIQQALKSLERDPSHHLTGPFTPQTPISATPERRQSPPALRKKKKAPSLWADVKSGRWVVNPTSSFKILLIPIILYLNWELFTPLISKDLTNPFAPALFISHRIPGTPDDAPLYRKGYLDLVLIAYYIIVWSFVRQSITIWLCQPIARYFGIKKEAKLDRFGEQGYAIVYFAFFGTWGIRVMSQLPTWWYDTKHFWLEYPHWQMIPELKSYYLIQAAYWCQQLIVMIFGLEKPRKDYKELVAHHFVTLWLIGWSYLINLTYIGNAVYLSMDVPDTLLAFSKVLNYIRWENAKIVSFAVLLVAWTYFRHWLNLVMLWSVWTEFDLMPESSKRWAPEEGAWLTWWMKYQIFAPILLLQFLNLFWYSLLLRIAKRAIVGGSSAAQDVRSDDEDDEGGDEDSKKDD